jgi:hypothetical protein
VSGYEAYVLEGTGNGTAASATEPDPTPDPTPDPIVCDGNSCENNTGTINSGAYYEIKNLLEHLGESRDDYPVIWTDDPACNGYSGWYSTCGTLCKDSTHTDCATYFYHGSMGVDRFQKINNGVEETYCRQFGTWYGKNEDCSGAV